MFYRKSLTTHYRLKLNRFTYRSIQSKYRFPPLPLDNFWFLLSEGVGAI